MKIDKMKRTKVTGGFRKGCLVLLLILAMTGLCMGCGGSEVQEASQDNTAVTQQTQPQETTAAEQTAADPQQPDPDGVYDGRDEVALYLHTYGRLPGNYITREEARALGWEGGSVEQVASGKCIGGDRFGNYEQLLPEGEYHECDIDTLGKESRGAKRLIYTDDDIYYTDDHYESFVMLYDEEGAVK